MCLSREEAGRTTDGSSSADVPDEAYRAKPGLVESYAHSKKVGSYLIGRQLGEGSFAKVREALHAVTGERVAVKIVSKETAKTDAYVAKNMRREGRIQQMIRHPNVAQLLEVMETEHSYYLVQELCQGGNFMAYLARRRRLTEAETRRFVRQMVQAVDYMHSMGILHRDLKIENLLLTEDQKVKIIDFGLSNMLHAVPDENGTIVISQLCRTQCGSPAYAAPEVLAKKTYGTAVDVWSIGVNMFAMLTGNLPFTVKPFSIKALHHKMVNRQFSPMPRDLSASCRDLLMRLLNPQPETRITLRDVMSHPWLNENVSHLRPSPFPNLLSQEDLRRDVAQQASQQLEVPVSQVARKVLDNSPGPCLSTYYLLAAKVDRYCRQNPAASRQPGQEPSQVSPGLPNSEGAAAPATSSDVATEADGGSSAPKLAAAKATQSSPDDDAGGFCCPSSTSRTNESPASVAVSPSRATTTLPRRERTIAGASVPVSEASAEATELVRLSRDEGGSGGDDAELLSRTARAALPRCPERRTQSDRGCHTARASPAALPRPLRHLPRQVSGSGPGPSRTSIQSLVAQRYARVLLASGGVRQTTPATPTGRRYQQQSVVARCGSYLSATSTTAPSPVAAAYAAATAAATASVKRPSMISAKFAAGAAAAAATPRPPRFVASAALRGVTSDAFIRR